MKKTIFEYEGHPITFEDTDITQMINATEMAKPFPKKATADFLRLKSTKEFVELLKSRYGNSHNGIINIIQGGNDKNAQGTWMCEELALEFAGWLSPAFRLWMNDRIRELLKTGKTEIETRPGYGLIKSIRMIADQLEAHEQEIQNIKSDVSDIKDYVGEIEARLTVQDKNFLSVAAYCNLHNIDCPLDKAQKWGIKATALSKKLDKHFYHIHDPRFGRVGVYHTDVLEQIIS